MTHKLFDNPEAVKKLQYIWNQENGELVNEDRLEEIMIELKDAQLIGFMNDYCGYSRCYISKVAHTELLERGLIDAK